MQTTVKWTLSIIVLIVFLGCGGEEKPTSPATTTTTTTTTMGNIPAALYGKWVYVDDATEVELDSTTTLDYTQSSSNILKVGSRFLLRASVANTHVEGTVLGDTTTGTISANIIGPRLSSLSGIGGINVILKNTKDPNIKAEVTTVADGSFNDDSLPSGLYTVEGSYDGTSFKASTRIEGNQTNLGNFQLADANGYNFKAELIMDKDFIYADEQNYTGVIRIHNTGSADGVDIWADFNITDYYLKSFDYPIVNKYIKPGEYSDINITFSFNPLKTAKRTINVDVKVGDARNNTWNDRFTFDLYRRAMQINMASDTSAIRGFVVYEGNKIVPFNTSNGSLNIPVDPASNIYMLVSNVTGEATKYSVGIDTSTIDYSNVRSSDHEGTTGNDTEETATTLALGSAVASYAGTGDLDYFSIDQSTELESIYRILDENITNATLSTRYQSTSLNAAAFILTGETLELNATGGTLVINGIDTNLTHATVESNTSFQIALTSSTNFNTTSTGTLNIGSLKQAYRLTTKAFSTSNNLSLLNMEPNSSGEIAITNSLATGESTQLCTDIGTIIVNNNDTGNSCATISGGDLVKVKVTGSSLYNHSVVVTLTAGGHEFNATFTTRKAAITPSSSTLTIVANDSASILLTSEANNTTYTFSSPFINVSVIENNITFTPLYNEIGNYSQTVQSSANGVAQGETTLSINVVASLLDTNATPFTLKIGTPASVANVTGVIVTPTTINPSKQWQSIASMNTPRSGHTLEALDGKLYAIGGRDTDSAVFLNSMEIYDPTQNTWSYATPMTNTRIWHKSLVYNGKIYVFGGFPENTANNIEVYNPSTQTWSTASMSRSRYDQGLEIINDVIYLIGGSVSPLSYTNDVESFNPQTNTLESLPQLNTSRYDFKTVQFNNAIYAISGRHNTGVWDNIIEEYNITSKTWSTKTPLTTERVDHEVVELNGKIYIMGGAEMIIANSSYAVINNVEIFDPIENSVTPTSVMNVARKLFTASKVGERIYVTGGEDNSYNELNSTEVFDLNQSSWTLLAAMKYKRTGHKCIVLDGKLYVVGGYNATDGYFTQAEFYDLYDYTSVTNSTTQLNNGLYKITFNDLNSSAEKVGYAIDGNTTEVFNVDIP